MTDLVSAVRRAREETVAAGSSRVSWLRDVSWSLPQFPARPARGPVQRLVRRVRSTAGKVIVQGASGLVSRLGDPRHLVGAGVVDLSGRRVMVDFGSYATVQIGTQEWSGRSGRPLDTLPAAPPHVPSPLWLIDLVGGMTTARPCGAEEVAGENWQHLTGTASLAEASEAAPKGMPTPARDDFDELLALPIEVWLDDGQLRRIRFVSRGAPTP